MRIAFLGLGIMGGRMAAHLVDDHELAVWTHSPGKAAAWAAEHGGRPAEDVAEAVAGADVVCSMVVDGAQVRALADALPATEGGVLLDLSTIGPQAAREVAASVAGRGWAFVDAPVTGSSPKAEAGTLTIMVGGEPADVDRVRPLLDAMGALVVHLGGVGQGQLVKVISNAVGAVNAAAVAEALVVGDALGADLDGLVEVMGAGSAGSYQLTLKAGPMRAHDFAPLFRLDHMLKDVRLCLEQAQAGGVGFPAAAEVAATLQAAVARGLGDEDYSALLEVVEERAGHRLSQVEDV